MNVKRNMLEFLDNIADQVKKMPSAPISIGEIHNLQTKVNKIKGKMRTESVFDH